MEDFLQLLEEGKPLPPNPRELGRRKESAQSFLTRMDKLQARYDAQFLKRKDWRVRPAASAFAHHTCKVHLKHPIIHQHRMSAVWSSLRPSHGPEIIFKSLSMTSISAGKCICSGNA